MAACSALEVTLYVSKDCEVNLAACFAVAHSSSAGAFAQDSDEGAMARSWDSVKAASRVKREIGIGVAVVWMASVRVRERRRVWRCIL